MTLVRERNTFELSPDEKLLALKIYKGQDNDSSIKGHCEKQSHVCVHFQTVFEAMKRSYLDQVQLENLSVAAEL